MNDEIDTFREEFDPWVEADNLGRSFFQTPHRLNSFLDPEWDEESRKYNFTVLIDSSDKLRDVVQQIEWAFSDSYNWVYENEYRTMYHRALEDLIGRPVLNLPASSESLYDVTDFLSTILWEATRDGEDPGNITMTELIEEREGLLTPGEPFEPDEDNEVVIEDYNEHLKDIFG